MQRKGDTKLYATCFNVSQSKAPLSVKTGSLSFNNTAYSVTPEKHKHWNIANA